MLTPAVPVVRFVEPAGGVTKCSWSICRCSVAAAMRSVTSAVPAGVAKSGPLTVASSSPAASVDAALPGAKDTPLWMVFVEL